MNETTILQLISSSGAAVILFYALYMLITGKLHTQSEVDGLNKVIAKQDSMIDVLTSRLEQVNDIFEKAIERGYTANGRT